MIYYIGKAFNTYGPEGIEVIYDNDLKNISDVDVFILPTYVLFKSTEMKRMFKILFDKNVPIIMWFVTSGNFQICSEQMITSEYFPKGMDL